MLYILENTELLEKMNTSETRRGRRRRRKKRKKITILIFFITWEFLWIDVMFQLGGYCKVPNEIHLAGSPFNYNNREDFKSTRRT